MQDGNLHTDDDKPKKIFYCGCPHVKTRMDGVIMTNTNILSINFYAGNITDEARNEFMQAVNHETADMTITLLTDSISKLESKIANKNETYTEEEVQAFETQRDKLVEERTKFEETSEATQEVYDKVVSAMSLRNIVLFCDSITRQYLYAQNSTIHANRISNYWYGCLLKISGCVLMQRMSVQK